MRELADSLWIPIHPRAALIHRAPCLSFAQGQEQARHANAAFGAGQRSEVHKNAASSADVPQWTSTGMCLS